MKKGLILVMTIALLTIMVGAGFAALFSDTESIAGNTFTAGSLDLKVDGSDDPLTAKFFAADMVPGEPLRWWLCYSAECRYSAWKTFCKSNEPGQYRERFA